MLPHHSATVKYQSHTNLLYALQCQITRACTANFLLPLEHLLSICSINTSSPFPITWFSIGLHLIPTLHDLWVIFYRIYLASRVTLVLKCKRKLARTRRCILHLLAISFGMISSQSTYHAFCQLRMMTVNVASHKKP
jgi:hypothetical protein